MMRAMKQFKSLGIVFYITVLIPTLCAVVYFGMFSADVYISESSFLVKAAERKQPTGIGALLGGVAGVYADSDDVYAVQDFAESRDAMEGLNKGGALRRIFGNPDIAFVDRFGAFGWRASNEDLYQYYRKHVEIETDSRSSLTKIKVRAYKPADAQKLNRELLEQSEGLVNRLNKRAETDQVAFAQHNMEEAASRAKQSAATLSNYRNQHRVADPEKQSAILLQLVAKLQDDLISSQSQLDQVLSIAPDNAQVAPLRARIASLRRQIESESARVTGSDGSFAGVTPVYERLLLDNQLADKQLAAAMNALQEAKEDASRKRIYVETVVQPSLPDNPAEPRRARNIFAVLVIGLMLWGVASMLVAGVREHGY